MPEWFSTPLLCALLSAFSESGYAQCGSARSGNAEQGKPQGGIAVVPGFRRVTEFVVHLHFRHRTLKHGCRLVGGEHIGGRCAVRHLGYHILTDTEIINEDCIEELLGYCMRSDVGAVGARMYYEDDTIQHAGVVIGFGGIAGH